MSALQVLNEKALFEALAEYHKKYRLALETQGDRREINTYLDTLLSIMAEIDRRKHSSGKSEIPSRELKFNRESSD